MARLAAVKMRVPLMTGQVEINTEFGHHIQNCLQGIGRPFANVKELNHFLGLKEEHLRREFIAERV